MTGISIAKSLQLVLIRGELTRDDVRAACESAATDHLAAVEVLPVHVALAASILDGTDTRVIAAIGAPWGQDTVETKLAACDHALSNGAHAIAVMPDHSALASGDMQAAIAECTRLLSVSSWQSIVASRGRADMTIIIETMALDIAVLQPIWDVLHDSAAGFVQTSAGQIGRIVTVDHIRELREALPADIAITAVGGVANVEDAHNLIAAGATRVGSVAAAAIARQQRDSRTAHSDQPTAS